MATKEQNAAGRKTSNQLPINNIKEYLTIIRNNIVPILLIFITSVVVTIVYVTNAIDIFKTITTLKITKPQGSILSSSLIPEAESFQNDRFISNEIEILKSNSIREKVSTTVLDSFNVINDRKKFYYVLGEKNDLNDSIISYKKLTTLLNKIVSINQKRGLDIVEIEVESPSSFEAMIIADIYANVYQKISLDFSRRELTTIREFLALEKDKRFNDLTTSEGAIQDYQQRGGILFLDEQSKKIVDELSNYQADRNAAEVMLQASQKASNEIKDEMSKIDKSLLDYLSGELSQSYFEELQKKIVELEVQRDVEISVLTDERLKDKISKEYQRKIDPLKKTLDDKIVIIKTGILANTPHEKSLITQRLFESELDVIKNRAKLAPLNKVISKIEALFNKLPAQSIELARLERNRKSFEKLYLTLEEKYQEALVNERAKLGNVIIIDKAQLADKPSKPNRQLIVTAGAILGLALGVGFAFLRDYLDRSVKTPEEIEGKGVSVLSWIPSIEELKDLGSSQLEFIVANKPNATASESFKALRTRVYYAKIESQLKTILVTSSLPSEGKTTVALNLAGSFALADKKVLLIDCDLRKPRIHAIFQAERYPGLSDYLFSNVSSDEIIRKTKLENMDFISSGTIPPNPSELLGSKQMVDFLHHFESIYDIIVLDSPPYISVTDAEILSRISDGTILVCRANKTPMDAFLRAHDRIVENENHKFLGSVLNNFSVKSAYGYYYNYYYYYSKPDSHAKKKVKSQIKG
ncbi:MAG: polysaccharide biosynthesis tyrosine autokinase [Ignavibacteria bacterium]